MSVTCLAAVGLTNQVELTEGRHGRLPVDHRGIASDAVQSLRGDRLEHFPHGGIASQHRGEMFDGQREQVAVGLGTHACHPLGVCQQTYLCSQIESDQI